MVKSWLHMAMAACLCTEYTEFLFYCAYSLPGSDKAGLQLRHQTRSVESISSPHIHFHQTHKLSLFHSIVTGKRTAFEQYEAQLYEELQTIIGETGVLHTALDRTLRLEIEAYQKALEPIASTTQRLEQLGTASGSSQGTPASSVAGYGAGTGYTGGPSEKSGYTGGQSGYGGQAGGQSGYGGQAPGLQYPGLHLPQHSRTLTERPFNLKPCATGSD